ncbi:MAG: hypothetical protein U0T75_09795 [Chitinophagales bacterium]
MDFDKISYKKIDKTILKKHLFDPKTTAPSKRIIKELLKKIELSVINGDYLTARNGLLVTLFYAPDETFDLIRKRGLFRYSRYANKKCIVKSLATELVEICKEYGTFNENIFSYLYSIINYSSVLVSYNAFEHHIIAEFKRFEKKYKDKSIIKTLLSAVDFLFLSGFYPKTNTDLSEISNRTKEDISAGVSYLIHVYTNRIRSENINIGFVSEEYIKSGDIGRLIIPACYYSDFKEFEVMIDHFDYHCDLEGEHLYIKPPFEEFEKSIRAGYIRTELQQINDRVNTSNALSLEEFVEKINEQEIFKFFKLTETHNYPRYRIELPEPIYDYITEQFIKPDNLFKEEVDYLSLIFKEQLLNPDDLNKITVKEDLTLYEFIKIRRVLIFFYVMFAKEIYKIEKVDTELLLRSLIPVYQFDQFYDFLERLLPVEKIDSFLDLVCWEPGSDFVFDLQYHPIIYLNNSFIIPLSIFANSNSIRNLFASEYKQSNTGLLNSGEPLVTLLKGTFDKIGIQAHSEISIGGTDIDVCAIHQDVLFVFECKHTLHPVSSYDLRTTYDYLRKAESQLDKINKSYNEGKLLEILERKIGVNLAGIKKIVSSIVLSNRLFNGNSFKYPVRNINEVINMLSGGTMRTENGIYNVWNSKTLTIDFMLDYFSLQNEMTTLLMDSLSKRTMTYEFAKPKLLFDSYYLDSTVAIPKLNEFTEKLEKIEEA